MWLRNHIGFLSLYLLFINVFLGTFEKVYNSDWFLKSFTFFYSYIYSYVTITKWSKPSLIRRVYPLPYCRNAFVPLCHCANPEVLGHSLYIVKDACNLGTVINLVVFVNYNRAYWDSMSYPSFILIWCLCFLTQMVG